MNNIFSYLTWRGDLKLTQSPFNEVDNLVLSTLSYLDFSGIVPKNGKQDITIQRAAAEYFSLHGIPQRPDPEKASSLELREWMLYLMADTCRFRNTALSSITLLRIRHNAANLEGDSTKEINYVADCRAFMYPLITSKTTSFIYGAGPEYLLLQLAPCEYALLILYASSNISFVLYFPYLPFAYKLHSIKL